MGPAVPRVRDRRRARRPRRRRASAGTTCSSWPAARPSATATPATSPPPRSPRRSAGTAPASPPATPPARPGSPRSTRRGRASWPGCATSRSWSAPTPRPKGFLAPVAGERWDDPDWLRFRLLGATNPTYFALYARRRMDLYGATDADFAKVKVKNARHGLHNPNARYRKEVTEEEVLASPMVADPLRLLEICATSDGAAAVVLTSMDYARKHAAEPGAHPRGVDGDAALPEHRHRDAELRHRLGGRAGAARAHLPRLDRGGRLRGGGHRPRRAQPGRGLRPVHRARARLVREHRALQARRGGAAAQRRRHDHRRPHPREPERWPGLLRRGRPGPGAGPDLRGHLAAPRPGRGSSGRGGQGRPHRQPGALRPRRARCLLTA